MIVCNQVPSNSTCRGETRILPHSGQRHGSLLYVIIALLPKDGAALGGERPIGLLPIIVRIL